MRFAKNTQHGTSKVLRLPRKMTMDMSKVPRLRRKLQLILRKTSQKYCACHTKRHSNALSIRFECHKGHACHAKRSKATCETSKSDPFCRTYHRHGHTGIARTVADGCERLRTQTQRRANTPSTPRPPEWNGNPCYAFGKKSRPKSTTATPQGVAIAAALHSDPGIHGRQQLSGSALEGRLPNGWSSSEALSNGA